MGTKEKCEAFANLLIPRCLSAALKLGPVTVMVTMPSSQCDLVAPCFVAQARACIALCDDLQCKPCGEGSVIGGMSNEVYAVLKSR